MPYTQKSLNSTQKGVDVRSGHQTAAQIADNSLSSTATTAVSGVQTGNHSISLVISADKDNVVTTAAGSNSSAAATKSIQHPGLVKIGGGPPSIGRSAPSTPLPTRIVGGSGGNGGGGVSAPGTTISIARATPPSIPPRQNHQHVSTTYINQEKHTIHVTAPNQTPNKASNGGPVAPAAGDQSRNGSIKEKPPRKRNDSINPEILIDLVDSPVPRS